MNISTDYNQKISRLTILLHNKIPAYITIIHMNQIGKRIMWTSILAPILIVMGVTLLVLGSLPIKNTIENSTLTVNFVIGKKVIDITEARFLPVPDDVDKNLIRTNGTSVGKKKSGHFKNTKTKNKYIFYLTGNGERVYFEIGDKKYLIDNVVCTNN